MEKHATENSFINTNRVFTMKRGSLRGTYLGPDAIKCLGKLIDTFQPGAVGFITSGSSYKTVGAWEMIDKVLVARNIP